MFVKLKIVWRLRERVAQTTIEDGVKGFRYGLAKPKVRSIHFLNFLSSSA
jgi:hypothetical protein